MATVALIKNNGGDCAELKSHSWTGTDHTIAGGGWWLLDAHDEIATLVMQDQIDLSVFNVEGGDSGSSVTVKNMNSSPIAPHLLVETVNDEGPETRVADSRGLAPGQEARITIGLMWGLRITEVPKA